MSLFFCALLIGCTLSCCQAQQSSSNSLFYSLNGGIGIPYGGWGLNAEFGGKLFSGYAAFGYARKKKVSETITLEDSFNPGIGFRFYLPTGSAEVYPRAGVQFGWINNYYNQRLMDDPYDPSVYGLSLHLGTAFYPGNGAIVSFDLSVSSNSFILNPDDHPHFNTLYFRPAIGLGYDFTGIIGTGSKKKTKTRTIDFSKSR